MWGDAELNIKKVINKNGSVFIDNVCQITLSGKSINDAELLFNSFHGLITNENSADEKSLGKLAVLAGVKDFPVRVKCATMAWHTLTSALEKKND